MNISVLRIFKLAFISGGIHPSRIHVFIIYFLKILVSFILSVFEMIFLHKRIAEIKIQSPIFIIGHYRSGTTFLHKLLLADKRFAFLTCTNVVFPFVSILFPKANHALHRFINSLNLYNRCFNNKKFRGEDPSEEDLMAISAGMKGTNCWGYLFPRNAEKLMVESVLSSDRHTREQWKKDYLYTMKRLSYLNKGKRLVLKNPPNTGRIKELLDIFPDARFIFIVRNPYHVFLSMEYLWKHVVKSLTLQKFSYERQKEIIFYFYTILMNKYLEERNLIPKKNLVEIRYEGLKSDAFRCIEKLYHEMGFEGFDDSEKELREVISRENRYVISPYRFTEEIITDIEAHWKPFIDQWNYTSPIATNNFNTSKKYGKA